MADNSGVVKSEIGLDLPAHEETYSAFIALTQNITAGLLCIVLLLVLWGLEGHGGLALIGLVLTVIAGVIGSLTDIGWKAVIPAFVLIGLVCLVG